MFFFLLGNIEGYTVITYKNTPCLCVKRVRRTCVSVSSVCSYSHVTSGTLFCDSGGTFLCDDPDLYEIYCVD